MRSSGGSFRGFHNSGSDLFADLIVTICAAIVHKNLFCNAFLVGKGRDYSRGLAVASRQYKIS